MTDETDVDFLTPYQTLESDFIIRESQQRAGLMTGTIKASNNLVQTFSAL
jgi:hypothetical protein